MPALNIEFTESELAELRSEAEEKGVPVKRLAHDVLAEDVVARRQRQRFVADATRFAKELQPLMEAEFPEGLR